MVFSLVGGYTFLFRGGEAMADVLTQFGAKVRELRVKQGLTQEGLAERCGLHWTYIGGLERGKKNPTLLTLVKIAAGLKIGLGDLLERRVQQRALSAKDKTQIGLLRLLRKKDAPTLQLAVGVVRDVLRWQDRYGRDRG